MRGNDPLQWSSLIVERGATPLPLDDMAFRQWMSGRRIFVSSVMNDELRPDREALRTWLTRWGATPVMWEAITPRDQDPKRAYLEGVDSSDALVLLLGSFYGAADASGYSPTHEEANRARDQRIPRLLFERGGIAPSDRSGKLNEWVRELYREVAGAQYRTPDDLCALLEARLREAAAREESMWLKLGPVVFPGHVTQRRTGDQAVYTVSARVRDGAVRRALTGLGTLGSGVRADRLTWTAETQPVTVREVVAETERTSSSTVAITCAQPSHYYGAGVAAPFVTHVGAGGRSYGPAEQAEIWAETAMFGAQPPDRRSRGMDMVAYFAAHEGPTLPAILTALKADAWLAEGLVRLFAVEHITTRYGHVEQLDVGPATATAIRLGVSFRPANSAPVILAGLVPLP